MYIFFINLEVTSIIHKLLKIQVTGVGGKGLFLRLGKKNLNVRGFVPERRIGFNFKGKLTDNDDDSTMLQRLRTKYPLGSSVRCRLLYFDIMSCTYICSMEKYVNVCSDHPVYLDSIMQLFPRMYIIFFADL